MTRPALFDRLPPITRLWSLAAFALFAACVSNDPVRAGAADATVGDAEVIDGMTLDAGDVRGADAGQPADATATEDTGASARLVCVETCSGGGACTPPTVCDGSRCVFPAVSHPCATDHDCVPVGSFWDLGSACTTAAADCAHSAATGAPLEACLLVGAEGHCVRMPQSSSDCANRGKDEVPWTDIEGHAVTVCGRTSYLCDARECVPGCATDHDCTSSLYPHCNVATRRCGCTQASCASANNGRVCGPDGACGCANDDDCPGPGFDRCYAGRCGCSDTASCAALLPELTVVCEAPR